MEKDEIIVRKYSDKDYADIIEGGYPSYCYLRPDFYNRIKNLVNINEIEKKVLKTFFRNQEEIVLVAYSKKDRKPIGVATLRRITYSLWGIWSVFVLSSSRGKRIASLLYQESFKLLKERKIKKVIAQVFLDNAASLKSIKRNWQGFLSTRIFACAKKNRMGEERLPNEIRIRRQDEEKRNLFETFRNCVGEQWCRILEIDKNNFLDRIFGPAYFEPISKNFLARSMMKKDVFVAEYKRKIVGYAISRMIRFFHIYGNLHLFIPVSDKIDDVCRELLTRAYNPAMYDRRGKFNLIYIGESKVENHLRKLGFEVRVGVVSYKYL